MPNLGTIRKISDLRTIWPHEAHDFTKWLAKEENLSALSEAVGIDIVLSETESSVGSFNVDIFAIEEGTSRKIIIENQLEDTNHDHLGKIITYASGKGAEIIIWIVKRARDEHRQAVEWLNQHTDENIGFFLVEIELWAIDNSLPAPKFNIIERPNDWAKTMKASEGLSETKKLQLDFWSAFADYAASKQEFHPHFKKRKPQAQHWYSQSVGTSLYEITFSVNSQKKVVSTEIYIWNSKELFHHFKENQAAFEQDLGCKAEWIEATKACRIIVYRNGDVKKTEIWPSLFDWFCNMLPKLKSTAKKYEP